MALLETNFAAGQLKGSVGEMVIVRYKRGVKIVRRKPVRTSERTAAELASQERFAQASAYAKGAMADPASRAVYETAALRLHRTETRIGGAQKDSVREWANQAANMRGVMWAGILMLTLVPGVLLYFGWWTKAAVAASVGISMIVLAQTLPDHGTTILLGGIGAFALAALLILYAYHKGQLDRDRNGVPDFLERKG